MVDAERILFLDGLQLRMTTPDDILMVMYHRRMMFQDMGFKDETQLEAMQATSIPYFEKKMQDDTYFGWLVENEQQQVIAGGGIVIIDVHSSPAFPLSTRPHIVNVYTEPAYRRNGIARKLMETMLNWCREQNYGVVGLHASPEAKHLYESMGFTPTNEMKLVL